MTPDDNAAPGRQAKAYLVGGGIAALASAAYLIRDGAVRQVTLDHKTREVHVNDVRGRELRT